MARNFSTLLLVSAVIQVFNAGCDNTPWAQDSAAGAALPGLTGAKATSNHYVEVTFAGSADDAAEVASNYTIIDPDGNRLPVHTAELSADARQVILATDPQKQILYTLTVPTKADPTVRVDLVPAIGIGTLGFVGSSDREPFLESAISLSNSEILLSFSERMDRESAEDIAYYRIADPDGETDLDIEITEAVLDEDETSVVLQTTPQDNIEYTISVTNAKSRFTCADGELVLLDDSDLGQGDICTELLNRPLTTEDLIAPFSMTARTMIDTNGPTNPNATGVVGTVVTSSCGAGVMLACSGSESISGSGTTIPDEELIFTFDRSFRADRIVLTLQEIEFTTDEPVFFVSTVETEEEFYTITEPEIRAAFAGHGISRGNVLFEALESLDPTIDAPYREHIDVLKLRETNKAYCVESICLTDGRRIDPTRRTVQFFGIPSEDTQCPELLGAVSTSDITVLLSFSEPMDNDAADPINFEITCFGCEEYEVELLVLDAALTRHNTQIVLTTHPQTATVEYMVTVSNTNGQVTDLSVNHNPICSDPSEAWFIFGGQPSIEPGYALPRVVGAASTSNTTVVVAFNKPMSDSALEPLSYSIVQVNVNSEVGTLYVLDNACDAASENPGDLCTSDEGCQGGTCLLRGPRFLGPDRTALELTTTSQNEVTYEVTVTNVHDLAGNQLAPREDIVDPSKAQFAGTPPSCPPGQCQAGSGNPEGTDGTGTCHSDDHCDDDPPCSAGEADCEGKCDSQCQLVDTDGDGLSDNEELRGWVVFVVNTDGTVSTREVTSDPTVVDTDADGLDDKQEKRRLSDPRDPDTDDDLLPDHDEATVYLSSLTSQDTDADGLDDSKEVMYFKTSPILEDTDGDGFTDRQEVIEFNRDPRVADLPIPDINVGNMRLQIDERYSYTDEWGETIALESSSNTTMVESSETKYSNSDTQVTANSSEWFVKAGVGLEFDNSFIPKVAVNVEGGYTASKHSEHTSQWTAESSSAAQRTLAQSLSKGRQLSATHLVTRDVFGAGVDADITITNAGEIAFSISNVELTVLEPSGLSRDDFLPVATLLPNRALITGESPVYNLGPFTGELGPFMFSSRDVFPNLVEDLMREPRGLIFKVANYDVSDEFGRNFAFATQAARDRTAGISIDFGDGTRQTFFVATSGSIDDEGFVGGGFVGGFDENGVALGIPIDYALQDILGMTKNATQPDAIIAGGDGVADSIALGDDIQLIPPETEGVEDNSIVVAAGDNGVLDTSPHPDDELAVTTGYATSHTCVVDLIPMITDGGNGIAETVAQGDDVQIVVENSPVLAGAPIILPGDNEQIDTQPGGDDVLGSLPEPGETCDSNADCPGGAWTCTGPQVLVRVRNQQRGDQNRFWAVFAAGELPAAADFGDIILRPGEDVALAFVQDIDHDGVLARDEFFYGSSDKKKDSDGDGLFDFAEIRVGWDVGVLGSDLRHVYPDPRVPDGDGDDLEDPEEQDLRRLFCRCAGDPPNKPCGDDDDCDGDAECECTRLYRCSGGKDDYLACSSDASCAEGSCQSDRGRCNAGPNAGEPCTSHEDCGGAAFTDIEAGLTGVNRTCLSWGDYDGDGYLDLALAGWTGSNRVSRLYHYDNVTRTFEEIDAGLILKPVCDCSLAWGHYDDDEHLDLALAGMSDQGRVSLIYQGDGLGNFTDTQAGLTPVSDCCLSWGNYNNDEHLDLALAGMSNQGRVSLIYQGDGLGNFTDTQASLTPVSDCSLSWGDYDGDGNLDLALAGDAVSHHYTRIYHNEGPDDAFTLKEVTTVVPYAVAHGSVSWGDYDNDGDLDLGLAGLADVVLVKFPVACIYRNDREDGFTEICPGLTGVYDSSLSWGDYDGDGNLDLALAGMTYGYETQFPVSAIYRYDGNDTFTDIGAGLTPVSNASVSWGDYDGDGDPDLALAGLSDAGRVSQIYRNEGGAICDFGPTLENVFGAGAVTNDDLASDPRLPDTDTDGIKDIEELSGYPVGLSITAGPNGVCETQALGDDVQKVFIGYPVNPLGTGMVILAGPNGKIDSAPGGDDELDPGQIVYTNPLDPDHDGDTRPDGLERANGGNPTNPDDPPDFLDSDRDGLSDLDEEQLGWEVCVPPDCRRVWSNRYAADTDLDGLPDFLERELTTDPTLADTDNDGLDDYDEFADFARYIDLHLRFPGFVLDGTDSMRLGTNPRSKDTDGDGLEDKFEVTSGWRVYVLSEVRDVTSDPLFADTDSDGADDQSEYLGANGREPSADFSCTTGPNVGQHCGSDDDCPLTYPGVCRAFCQSYAWGSPLECSDDNDCWVALSPYLPATDLGPCITICQGGSNAGLGCDNNDDCPAVPGTDTCRIVPDATDPTDRDTDDDGALDGRELAAGSPSNPLIPDVAGTIRVARIEKLDMYEHVLCQCWCDDNCSWCGADGCTSSDGICEDEMAPEGTCALGDDCWDCTPKPAGWTEDDPPYGRHAFGWVFEVRVRMPFAEDPAKREVVLLDQLDLYNNLDWFVPGWGHQAYQWYSCLDAWVFVAPPPPMIDLKEAGGPYEIPFAVRLGDPVILEGEFLGMNLDNCRWVPREQKARCALTFQQELDLSTLVTTADKFDVVKIELKSGSPGSGDAQDSEDYCEVKVFVEIELR